jgi:hypothetical protein
MMFLMFSVLTYFPL